MVSHKKNNLKKNCVLLTGWHLFLKKFIPSLLNICQNSKAQTLILLYNKLKFMKSIF